MSFTGSFIDKKPQRKTLLRVSNLHKSFPGTKALKGVNLEIFPREIHALVGENGAGKSTIIKCIMGVHQKDCGFYFINDKLTEIHSPNHAMKLGLGAVYQDVMMAPDLSVAENFFLGQIPNKMGIIYWKRIYEKVDEVLDKFKIEVNGKDILGKLPVAKQEMVTIAKMFYNNCKIVIFDEPTALLSNKETEILFSIIKAMKNKNLGILYVSHRLEEILEISDRVTIFKDGENVKTLNTSDTSEDEIIKLMIGRTVSDFYNIKRNIEFKENVLEVKNLTRHPFLHNISFNIKRGEIFGIFGLVGSGRTKLVETIAGSVKKTSGTIRLNHSLVDIKTPKDAIKLGIGFLTEDRKKNGLFMNLSCMININFLSYNIIKNIIGIINYKDEKNHANKYKDKLNIKSRSIFQQVKDLSGGNQQKIVLSKWLSKGSNILIIDEPTTGIDIGAKIEIYRSLEMLLSQGKTIILISSYLPEVLGLSDRLMVMHEGKNMGILDRKNYNLYDCKHEEKFIKLASGIKI